MAKKSLTQNKLIADFHGKKLTIVENNNEPYVSAKEISEAMGLAWNSQYTKLNSNRKRWGVMKIIIPSKGGKQTAVGMPLRKLPAWLASIQVNRLSNELKPIIIQYQEECDEVLWNHWNGKKTEAKPALSKPNIAIRDDSRTHVWMVRDAQGQFVEMVDLHQASDVSNQVNKYFDSSMVVNKKALLKDFEKIVDQLMIAQHAIKQNLTPLMVLLGTKPNPTQADIDAFWEEKVSKSGEKLRAVV